MKKHRIRIITGLALAALMFCVLPASAQRTRRAPKMPEGVEMRSINIYSDGTRMSGELVYPTGWSESDNLPVVILCHGWGGTRDHLRRDYAPGFAKAGYVAVVFDYRGWGDSDSRLVIQGDMPKPDAQGMVEVKAQAIRELVDPVDQPRDIINVINYIMGEPGIDTDKIGLWGTSYGGGHVVWVAAHDPRVKCIVAQVGSMDSSAIPKTPLYKGGVERAISERTLRARGELPPVPQGVDQFPGLKGTPYVSRMVDYRPVDFADQLEVPTFIIDVGKEELFRIEDNGLKVYDIIKDRILSKHHLFAELTHYGIYFAARKEGLQMAIDWFDEHLK